MRIVLLFPVFSNYHLARLRTAQSMNRDVIGLEVVDGTGVTGIQGWREVERRGELTIETMIRGMNYTDVEPGYLCTQMYAWLDKINPDVVALPGWIDKSAMAALRWCADRRKGAVLMSDSSAKDKQRRFLIEQLKSRIVRCYGAALVAGTVHVRYVAELGMPMDRIFTGYDVVDNDYFSTAVDAIRANPGSAGALTKCSEPFFLASARFIERKNLIRLIEAYHMYRQKSAAPRWKLVILGDGPQRLQIEQAIRERHLTQFVHLPGFVSYNELPAFYALAGAFVHPSISEQWGLVINEAMASGLPVVVSDRCGAAPDLVQNGVNGWTFNPYDVADIAEKLEKVQLAVRAGEPLGEASRRIVSEWSPARFAEGLFRAAETAVETPTAQPWFVKSILWPVSGLSQRWLTH